MSRKGFSLIELVVVILLIGILSAVAVPRLFQSIDKAYDAAVDGFRATAISALNGLRAEWVLLGTANPFHPPGAKVAHYFVSKHGFPYAITDQTVTVEFARAVPTTEQTCIELMVDVFGKPFNVLTFKSKADQIQDQHEWMVLTNIEAVDAGIDYFPLLFESGAQVTSGCVFVYLKDKSHTRVLYYNPFSRNVLVREDYPDMRPDTIPTTTTLSFNPPGSLK